MPNRRTRLRRILGTLSLLSATWSLALLFTGGIAVSVGAIHLSSRNARNPAIGAVLLLVLAACSAPAGTRWRTLADDFSGALLKIAGGAKARRRATRIGATLTHPRSIALGALTLVALTLATSWTRGAYIAGGADSYGYVSEAHLFATGRLRADVPLAHAFPHVPPVALTPLGYRPSDDGSSTLVPTYSPGLPLAMAVVERVAGMNAVYAVMPALAAIGVWTTYRLGLLMAGPAVGFGAALLLFASPAMLFQLMGAPMSDVPAMGWWALALAFVVRPGGFAAAVSGLAAGAAILTRPNLLLVLVVFGVYLLDEALREREHRPAAVMRLGLFAIGAVAGCIGEALFNAAWNGSPLRSGYGASLFSLSYWTANLARYPRWISETQTPIFALAFLAPFAVRWLKPQHQRAREVWLLTGVSLAVFVSYLFYLPFDAWWFLRFLLPAYPALAALTCITLAAYGQRFGWAMRAVGVLAVAAASAFGLWYAKDMDALGEYRYRIIAEWVRDHLPERSVILAMQHSGSVRHYSGRSIVRYDLVPPGDFDSALREITAAGYHPYLVVDEWELPPLQPLLAGGRPGGPAPSPIALLRLNNAQVIDLAADRDATVHEEPEIIPIPEFIRRRW